MTRLHALGETAFRPTLDSASGIVDGIAATRTLGHID